MAGGNQTIISSNFSEDENDDDNRMVEDGAELRRTVEMINSKKKQGTIKHYLTNSGFLESPSTSMNGGGENDRGGGATEATASPMDPIRMKSGPRGKNFWTEKAAKSKIKGAKSKNGRELKRRVGKGRTDSSQFNLKKYFLASVNGKSQGN